MTEEAKRKARALELLLLLSAELSSRKPLTDEEIDSITDQQWAHNNIPIYAAHRAYARAVEAAHGITGDKA